MKWFKYAFTLSKRIMEGAYINIIKLLAKNKLRKFNQPYKVNVGCGTVRINGWLNIDSNHKLKTVDLVWDVTNGFPMENDTCEYIYCEHLLEHLNVRQGVAFLRECSRTLRPTGVLRIAMPSLDDLLERSCNGRWREADWLTWPQYQFIKTRAEMINIAFRWWGHQWLYDREELFRRLKESGFNNIDFVEWGKSNIPELNNKETRKDSILICEAKK